MDSLDKIILDKAQQKEIEYNKIESLLESVEIMTDNKLFLFYQKQQKQLENVVLLFKNYKKIEDEIISNEKLFKLEDDEHFKNEIIAMNNDLKIKLDETFYNLKNALTKSDEIENQNVRIELSLKSGNKNSLSYLIDIIQKYCDKNKCTVNVKKQNDTSAIIDIKGNNIYDDLNIFSGNFKITINNAESIIGVVVLILKINNFKLNEDDVEVQTIKSDGAGGQHINKTESGIRLVHKPTKIVAVCKDERSQVMNKKRAFENLEKKILEKISQDEKKNIEFQRNKNKNALFSTTPAVIINLDKNIVSCYKTKKDYNLKQILDGDLKVISSDILINE